MTGLYEYRHNTLPCFVINNVLNAQDCDNIIADQKDKLEKASHEWKGENVVGGKKDTRDSSVAWYEHPSLSNIITSCVDTVNYEAGWRYDIVAHELFQFTEYKKGQHYAWHTDGPGCCHISARKSSMIHKSDALHYTQQTNLLGTVRKISISAILNDDYKGGELQFRTLSPTGQLEESSVACKTGDIIVFPSYLHHRVKPVTKGVRYSIVAWYGGPPFK